MAFDAVSFMEKFKAFVQPIFDEFKVHMLEIVAEKERRIAMASAANTAGMAATMLAQPEVEAATAKYCQEAECRSSKKQRQ